MRTQGDLEKAKEPLGMWGTGSVHSHILVHYGSFLSVLPLFQFQKGQSGKPGKPETQVTEDGSWLSLIISRKLSDWELHQVGSGW